MELRRKQLINLEGFLTIKTYFIEAFIDLQQSSNSNFR